MATQSNLPTRTMTNDSDDEAIPEEDNSQVTRLFSERLRAWKHACGYLEDYVTSTEKMQHAHGKEYEKVLKSVSKPLKEGEHFDQQLGGIAGLFDNIRSNTQGISNNHYETAKTLKGSVLPIFERLHTEIKNKTKELTKGAGKGSKAVEKARNTTQKHIELLGQHTASFDSTGGSLKADQDPYILQRGVLHRLNKQVIEENNNRNDLISVQNNFAAFEEHIVQTIQSGLNQFYQTVTKQEELTKANYGDIIGVAQRIPPGFEWQSFVKRNAETLIDPNAPARSVGSIAFPNQNHKATQPLIAGSLDRKGTALKKFNTGYYVISPSKYLHQFKTDDDFASDPTPEISLYLPDCMVGSVDGVKFNIKGKDASKSSIGSKLSMSHEYAFKAHTAQDAAAWHQVISQAAGRTTSETPSSTPSSPITDRKTGSEEASVASPTSPTAPGEGTAMPAGEKPPVVMEGYQAPAPGEKST
ncbi:hypothetical protein K402DRAFT_341325 [Aulographum hederae CBS 113979]|uniref:PH domain-containing protein n=1 Tax=Aulographum hederae CBS 113979 TaxID=1176131 RepID=A0A6G1GLZ6_9PEZI|nr:hypothetical protein K402DRAFT_341325 [Aulographum hederae CBS 113979]